MTTANGSSNSDVPDVLDVLIVGAGPCGLAVAARLQEETPSAMFTDEEHQRYHWIKRHSGHMSLVQAHNKKMNGVKAEKYTGFIGNSCCSRRGCQSQPVQLPSPYSTLVLDSSGDRWMERWNRSFRTLEIDQLRSPMFFHVDPGDRDGMLAFTMENGRERELWEISGCVGQEMSKHKKKKRTKARIATGEVEINERDRKDYFSPSTKLFEDYCSSVASRYGLDGPGQILQDEVADIKFDIVPEYSSIDKIFTVTTKDGRTLYSRTVVLAIGPGGSKIFPWQLSSTEEMGACHSLDIKTFPSPNVKARIRNRQETNVVVVGGGLSSAQVVDMAVRKGVTKVWFFLRGELKVKHFDIDLPWMGKFRNFEKAAFWTADDEEERLQMIQRARNGGSITPRYHKILKQQAACRRVSIHTHTVIVSKKFDPSSKTWSLTTEPPIPDLPRIDYIYFATGARSDVSSLPCLQTMNREYPINVRQGLPCITDDLMWKQGVPLFITGRLGALQLGPGAANLEGARLGAERIAWVLEEILGDKDDSKEKQPSLMSFAGLGNRYAGLFDTGESVTQSRLTREL
ncbi:hypothetical protein Plec18167_008281 [Paecilomyces lecythidis]|uniref:L-ornithine N(5)-monooxygenase n=1 Tax=Paecilomyces lecythidis TaxID=3004212 RepID=A0ABR3WXI2_9EURO